MRMATCGILTVTDPRRSTYNHFSVNPDARWAGDNLTEEERQAGMGVCASSNASEGMSAVFTDCFSKAGQVSQEGAAGQGQTIYNNDHGRGAELLVTGKASKKEDKKDPPMGLFYQLPQELQYAVIMCGKIHADETRKNFTEALRQQAIAREEKAKFARDKKLKAAEKQLIGASYLHQQYDSPRCCKTPKQAFDIYNALTTKTTKMKFVKKQIQT